MSSLRGTEPRTAALRLDNQLSRWYQRLVRAGPLAVRVGVDHAVGIALRSQPGDRL